VTQELPKTFACDDRRAAGEKATARRKRVKLTPMGVLEILMWCAGAGAILGFWLWQRGADLPASGNAITQRHSPTVAFPKAGTEMPAGVKLELWDEQFTAATEQSVLWNADPLSTGSASLAPTVPDLTPLNHKRAPSPETSEAVVPRADEAVATGWMKNQEEEAEQPAESANNDQNDGGLVVARLEVTSTSAGQGATDRDAATEPQISFAPEPPHLDLFGLPQFETTSHFVEPGATPALERPLITGAEPPLVIVPETEVVLPDLKDPADRSSPELQSQAAESPSTIDSAPSSVDRDSLVTRGEAALARGDLAAARLFFGRAAVEGDARGARGMARTFDPETFRKLRVIGIRSDPDEAARWYARSDLLQAVASAR
jgi:hypothetical protein